MAQTKSHDKRPGVEEPCREEVTVEVPITGPLAALAEVLAREVGLDPVDLLYDAIHDCAQEIARAARQIAAER